MIFLENDDKNSVVIIDIEITKFLILPFLFFNDKESAVDIEPRIRPPYHISIISLGSTYISS